MKKWAQITFHPLIIQEPVEKGWKSSNKLSHKNCFPLFYFYLSVASLLHLRPWLTYIRALKRGDDSPKSTHLSPPVTEQYKEGQNTLSNRVFFPPNPITKNITRTFQKNRLERMAIFRWVSCISLSSPTARLTDIHHLRSQICRWTQYKIVF